MRRARAVLLTALVAGLALAGGASAAPGQVPAQVELGGGDVCVWVVKDGRPVGYCVRPAG